MTFWDNQTKDNLFNFLRSDYEGSDNPTRVWIRDHVRGKVLDAACGAGADYEYLKDQTDYTGMDFTPKMLELCHEHFPEGKFVEGNIEKIPFKDKEFDVVLARHILEHLDGYEKAIDEVKRVGKKFVIVLFLPLEDTEKLVFHQDGYHNNTYSKKMLDYIGPCKTLRLREQEIIYSEDLDSSDSKKLS